MFFLSFEEMENAIEYILAAQHIEESRSLQYRFLRSLYDSGIGSYTIVQHRFTDEKFIQVAVSKNSHPIIHQQVKEEIRVL